MNPSLWRQAVLNQSAKGLYEVLPGKVYQVRGTDLASTTFIRGKTGWIVYDVLLTREAMAQSLKFFQQNVPEGGNLPVVAMIYSHSHADHFGGARAVEQAFPDVKVYGPLLMTKETVDENVLAGNAMSRRAGYQYGSTLKRQERGIVDAALWLEALGQMSVVEHRQSIRSHLDHPIQRTAETFRRLKGEAIDEIDADGTKPVCPCSLQHGQGLGGLALDPAADPFVDGDRQPVRRTTVNIGRHHDA